MLTYRLQSFGVYAALIALAVTAAGFVFVGTTIVGAASGGGGGSIATGTPETYEFLLEKKISDNIQPDGYTADQFSFRVTGGGVDEIVTLTPGTDVYASEIVSLPSGTYTVEEMGPGSFVPADWTVQWSGYGCENANGPSLTTTMTVTDDLTGNVCRADNQYRGDPPPVLGCTNPIANNYDPAAEEDNGSCTYDSGDTYTVSGNVWYDLNEDGIVDENEEYLEDWEVKITNGSTTLTTDTDSDGHYSFDVPAGVWTLSEVVELGWLQIFPTPVTYEINVPEDLEVLDEGNEELTLSFPLSLFMNVAQAQVVGGPFNFGNVFSPTCNFTAINTSVSANSTTTLNWDMTGADSVSIDNGIGSTTIVGSNDVFVTTDITYNLTALYGANSAVCPLSIAVSTSGGGSNPPGGGGGNPPSGGSGPTSSGGGSKIELSSSGGGSSANLSDPLPEPEVLGEQVTRIPLGAPNTGFGGTATDQSKTALGFFLGIVTLIVVGARTFLRV